MSSRRTRELGVVNLVQLQPSGLIVDAPESSPVGSFYDASRRVEVDRLEITSRGVQATLPTGEKVLDIHHLDHPDKAYDDDDLVCIGFSSHYEAMRTEFGAHMVHGIAGENILIDYSDEVWPEDLGRSLGIENQDSGEVAVLQMVSFAEPCVEFSRFCVQSPQEKLQAQRLGDILEFLGNGRRGFLLVLDPAHEAVIVRPGDKVFRLGDRQT
jgi:hypothetical protein